QDIADDRRVQAGPVAVISGGEEGGQDRADPGVLVDVGVTGFAEPDEESLVRLGSGCGVDQDRDRLGRLALGEAERPGGRNVVAPGGSGGSIGGGITDINLLLARPGGQAHGENERRLSAEAFYVGDVVDNEGGARQGAVFERFHLRAEAGALA